MEEDDLVKSFKRPKPDIQELKSRTKTQITGMKDIKIGYEIGIKRTGYKHHAIIIDMDDKNKSFEIVNLTAHAIDFSTSSPKTNIIKETMAISQLGRNGFLYDYYDASFQQEIVVKRANLMYKLFSNLGQTYKLRTFNCQHLASYCVTGVLFSKQAEPNKSSFEKENEIDSIFLKELEGQKEVQRTKRQSEENPGEKTKERPAVPPRLTTTKTIDLNTTTKTKKNRFLEWAEQQIDHIGAGELRLVILGRRGSGKSMTGNSILTADKFDSKQSVVSVTKHCQVETSKLGHRKITVVDTPSFFDNHLSEEDIKLEITECIKMSLPGPHAFLLVLKLQQCPDGAIKTFNRLFKVFGDDITKYVIVTFTGLDKLQDHRMYIDDYISILKGQLKAFITKCGDRFIEFDNHSTDEKRKRTTESLIYMIDDMIKKNGKHYTYKMYRETEANIHKRIEQAAINKQNEENKKTAEKNSKLQSLDDHIENVQSDIHVIKEQLERMQKVKSINRNQDSDKSKLEEEEIEDEILQKELQNLTKDLTETTRKLNLKEKRYQTEIDQLCKDFKLQFWDIIKDYDNIDIMSDIKIEKEQGEM